MNKLQNITALIGRVFLSSIFIVAPFDKITNYEATQGYMDSMGVPSILLPLVIAFELLSGLAILVGFKARLAAILLMGFTIVSALIFHTDFSDQIQMLMFLKNMSIAGGFFLVIANGAGAYAIDDPKSQKLL